MQELTLQMKKIPHCQDYDIGDVGKLIPLGQTEKKMVNLRKIIPANMSGDYVLDIGCNKGFFCIDAVRRGASWVLGIEGRVGLFDILNKIPMYIGEKIAFYNCQFEDFEIIRKFHLIYCFSVYHLIYLKVKDHDEIFRKLAKCLHGTGSVILELPLSLDDNFASDAFDAADLTKEEKDNYNPYRILHAASKHFGRVTHMCNSGFLRTRNVLLLTDPNEVASPQFTAEWEVE